MANELRIRAGAVGGQISDNPLSSSATTLTSDGLAALPAVGSAQHMAIILDPDGEWGAPEVVMVTAHTAGATTATIARGQKTTVARQHDRDVYWVHGPILDDYPLDVDVPWGGDLGSDYEFNDVASAAPTGWSLINQGSATYTESYGAGVLAVAANTASTFDWKLLVESLPGSWSYVVAKLSYAASGNETSNAMYGPALVLRESSTGKFVEFTYRINDGTFYTRAWTNPTTYGGTSYATQVVAAGISQPQVGEFYLKIVKNSGTSFDFYFSADGITFYPLYTAVNFSGFLTINQVGFGMTAPNNRPAAVACHWLRIR